MRRPASAITALVAGILGAGMMGFPRPGLPAVPGSRSPSPEPAYEFGIVSEHEAAAPSTWIDLDAFGVPHISYEIDRSFYYAVQAGPVWEVSRVASVMRSGSGMPMRVDADSRPHLVFSDVYCSSLGGWCSGGVYHLVRTGGSWQRATMKPTQTAYYASLALDSMSNPHVSYASGDFADRFSLNFLHPAGTSWIHETVLGSGRGGAYTSLALDGEGRPWIAFQDPGRFLRVIVRRDSLWALESVDTAAGCGYHASLALDAFDRPHIAHFDKSRGDLRYAVKTESAWAIELVDTLGNVGWYSSLALDSEGNPHILYSDLTAGTIKYARKRNGAWSIDVPPAPGGANRAGALTLDPWNNPVWSYCDTQGKRIRIADSRVHLTRPVGGEAWPAGSLQRITWTGRGTVDLSILRTDGSRLRSVRGLEESEYLFRVSDPGDDRQLSVVIERSSPYSRSETRQPVHVIPILAARPLPYRGGLLTIDLLSADGIGGAPGRVRLALYDLAGREVRVVEEGEAPAGTHTYTWDGNDGAGRPVANGVYFLGSEGGGYPTAVKVVVVRD